MATLITAAVPRQYMMVRPRNQQEQDLDLFDTKSIVAIGWEAIDLNTMNTAAIADALRTWNPDSDERQIGRWVAQIERFRNLHDGDRILVPRWNTVWLATATEEYRYDASDSYKLDYGHQRVVAYLRDDSGHPRARSGACRTLLPRRSASWMPFPSSGRRPSWRRFWNACSSCSF